MNEFTWPKRNMRTTPKEGQPTCDKGDEVKALKTLENGLKRFADAPALDQARALLYQAELAMRVNDPVLAQTAELVLGG